MKSSFGTFEQQLISGATALMENPLARALLVSYAITGAFFIGYVTHLGKEYLALVDRVQVFVDLSFWVGAIFLYVYAVRTLAAPAAQRGTINFTVLIFALIGGAMMLSGAAEELSYFLNSTDFLRLPTKQKIPTFLGALIFAPIIFIYISSILIIIPILLLALLIVFSKDGVSKITQYSNIILFLIVFTSFNFGRIYIDLTKNAPADAVIVLKDYIDDSMEMELPCNILTSNNHGVLCFLDSKDVARMDVAAVDNEKELSPLQKMYQRHKAAHIQSKPVFIPFAAIRTIHSNTDILSKITPHPKQGQ